MIWHGKYTLRLVRIEIQLTFSTTLRDEFSLCRRINSILDFVLSQFRYYATAIFWMKAQARAFYSTLVVVKEFIKTRSMVTIYMIEVRNYLSFTVHAVELSV